MSTAAPTPPEGTTGTDPLGTEPVQHSTEPVLELRKVNVVHTSRTGKLFRPDKVHAVKDADFTVARNETVGIVGESGCGKSTLARVMVGLQPVTSGEVLFGGQKMGSGFSARRKLGRAVSIVFQDPATALNPRLTVHEALIDPLNVHGIGSPKQREQRVRDLLHLVGLPQSALRVLPRQISGGQRQRVAIARALALEPDVIVADEPTSALDVSVRAQVLNLLTDLKTELGLGLVFISHDINTVRYVSDRIAVMYFGEIIETGPAQQVFENPQQEYTRTLLGATPSLLT